MASIVYNNIYDKFSLISFNTLSFVSPITCLITAIVAILIPQLTSSVEYPSIMPLNQLNKNSGQFYISQLCAGKTLFPILKRVEGAVLASDADADINCTITFRTKSSSQHFVIRFEELKLSCNDHLRMFDGDMEYGQQSIKDFSCHDNMASVPIIKTTSTFLTMRYMSDSKTKPGDGFRLVVTAVFDSSMSDCPREYHNCRNGLCISRSLFCDGINHCVDNSDESNCQPNSGSWIIPVLSLTNALGLLVVSVLVISTCVIMFIAATYCRRENPYAQYQHHIQRDLGVPLQTSSSVIFANHPPQTPYYYHHTLHRLPIIVQCQNVPGTPERTNVPPHI